MSQYKLKFNSEYRSIKKGFEVINPDQDDMLPQFTLITGENGAGKTHLLSAIRYDANPNQKDNFDTGIQAIKNNEIIKKERIILRSHNFQAIDDVTKDRNISLNTDHEYDANDINSRIDNFVAEKDSYESDSDYKKFAGKTLGIYQNLTSDHLEILKNGLPSEILQLYHEFFPINHYGILSPQIGVLLAREQNLILSQKLDGVYQGDIKKPEKGIEKINEIFKKYNFPFQFYIQEQDIRSMREPRRYLNKNGAGKVSSGDLSSGEKIIFELLLIIYDANYGYNNQHRNLELLLLDEPDAHLHPEMSKLLMDFIQDTIVGQFGVNVIMTTHSPVTIGIAPEDSVFQMSVKQGIGKLIKISQKDAINLLMKPLPHMLINPNNTRYVFCESNDEACYWNGMYKVLKSKLSPNRELLFIGCGLTYQQAKEDISCQAEKKNIAGGKDKVKEIVSAMKNNPQTFGLIDWDTCEITDIENKIFVSCENFRYSIESVLFDPVFMIMACLKLDGQNKKEEWKFIKGLTLIELSKLNQDKLQEYVDYFLKFFFDSDNAISKDNCVQIKYNENITLNISKEYLYDTGHTLEELLITKIPSLKTPKNKNAPKTLKQYIIEDVLCEAVPSDLIPKDIIHTFNQIIDCV